MAKGSKVAPKRAKRERKSYSAKQRNVILAAAAKEHLTAKQIQQRFGVKPVTYYSWRKKLGLAQRRSGQATGKAGKGQLRAEVRAKVAAVLPGIVKSEVAKYLDRLLRTSRKR